ncbi:hypothetical protein CHUAL_010784 [Chamberlinius hualienensis]
MPQSTPNLRTTSPLLPTPSVKTTRKPRATMNDLVDIIQRLESKFDSFDSKFNTLEQHQKRLEMEIMHIRDSINNRLTTLQRDHLQLNTNVGALATQLQETQSSIKQLTQDTMQLTDAQMKNDVLIYNLPVQTDIQTTVIDYISTMLNVPLLADQISNVHTMPFGRFCPTIRLQLTRQLDRNRILVAHRASAKSSTHNANSSTPFITENLSYTTRIARKALTRFQQRAIKEGLKASFRADKLLIDGTLYQYDPSTDDLKPASSRTPYTQPRPSTTPQ